MMSECDRQLRMAAEDRQIRFAAESILNASINSQRSSYTTQQSVMTPDSVVNEVLVAGTRYNGRMSNVRRFFCLFVTFDFLFTVLMWLICIMISGNNVRTAFMQQILHYQIKTSLFDIVMAAACRFTILLLCYALLHMDHWCIVALSTSSTCAFLLSKVFIYDWSLSSQPVFQVLLILTSFVLVWGEVWFLDIKVIPQETQARDWYLGYPNPERAPLLSPNLVVPPIPTENVGHFYTPMDSPDHSDDEEQINRKRGGSPFLPATISMKLPQDKSIQFENINMNYLKDFLTSYYYKPKVTYTDKYNNQKLNEADATDGGNLALANSQIEECRRCAPTLLKKCHDLITSDNWKVEKVTLEGDTISSMMLPKPDGKIFKITGTIDVSAAKLINCLFDNIETSHLWNKQVGESKKIHVIDNNTDLVYTATTPLGNGAIGARDFVILRHRGQYESFFMSSGISVNFSVVPNRKNYVRGENGVGCFATQHLANGAKDDKCQFVWLLNTNLKGWIPQKMVDMSMCIGLTSFMDSLRNHARTIKN